jgi:hypothetical protein
VAKRELALECDYSYEARCQQRFRQLVLADPDLGRNVNVPEVITHLSTQRLLTTEWVPGAHVDKARPPLLHAQCMWTSRFGDISKSRLAQHHTARPVSVYPWTGPEQG